MYYYRKFHKPAVKKYIQYDTIKKFKNLNILFYSIVVNIDVVKQKGKRIIIENVRIVVS